MSASNILRIKKLGFPWETQDPFLFCVHHKDAYPKGNDKFGPAVSLEGRDIGQDFTIKDGFRMYHGETVPGFPAHPHRGFETVTVVREGLVDHSDSLGSSGRYGNGDVQWMTAGKGVQHAEMFPCLNRDKDNPFELFQIWLNLPSANKFTEPFYTMLWSEDIPHTKINDALGKVTELGIISGKWEGNVPPDSPPGSWAAEEDHQVLIWTVKMQAGASWKMPVASQEVNRTLYFFEGSSIKIEGQEIHSGNLIDLKAGEGIVVENGDANAQFLLLQGKPIKEPVVQYGPFVMNTNEEIRQAMLDYQETRFGGWPWPSHDNIHDPKKGRFAIYPDGQKEIKG